VAVKRRETTADRAVILFGFAGMLRRSEVAALALADVDESPEGLSVTVRRSKTDQVGEGAVVAILPGSSPTRARCGPWPPSGWWRAS
jgi:integrase